tara:strand:- start:23941 stop:25152 length:1212 start_codon:yes stop_codon:yes gene_type:complete
MDNTMLERISKNVGCSIEQLSKELAEAQATHKENLISAGKTESDADTICLRMAATMVRKKMASLAASGCINYEGAFVSVPRAKDFAELSYKKMATQLETLPASGINNLVSLGSIMFYEPNGNGGYTRLANPSLLNKASFAEGTRTDDVEVLPKNSMGISGGRAFSLIWNNTMPSYPSGDANFRYGAARPLNEPERTSYFYGRKAGTDDELQLVQIVASGKMSRASYPTFTAGSIAARPNRDGSKLYLKDGVSEFVIDNEVESIFNGDPSTWEVEGLDITHVATLADIPTFLEALEPSRKWDALVIMDLEVIHIDPRERGGFVLSLGDLDYTSLSMPIDLWIPSSQEDLLDFGVGSVLTVVGSAWVGRDGDSRLTPTGWFVKDSIATAPVEPDMDESSLIEGWG